VRNAEAVVSVVSQVHPSETIRTLAEGREQEVARFVTGRGLDRALYDAIVAVDGSELDPDAARLLRLVLRDFRRSGVDRDEQTRQRLRELAERSTVVGQEFSRNIRDDVRSIRIAPQRLGGMPQDYIDAHPPGRRRPGHDHHRLPGHGPVPHVRARRAGARRARHELPESRLAGQRRSAARAARPARGAGLLLGYDGWPAFDAEVKMVGSSEAIPQFIDRITALAEPSARRDFDGAAGAPPTGRA
jgi:thimet oligopeptidase